MTNSTDLPRFDRPLTDPERNLMLRLAIRLVASQMGWPEQRAADALDECARDGDIRLLWTRTDARLIVCDNPLVHAQRDWLAFHASVRGWED